MTQHAAEGLPERGGVEPDLALRGDAALVLVDDLDRILDRVRKKASKIHVISLHVGSSTSEEVTRMSGQLLPLAGEETFGRLAATLGRRPGVYPSGQRGPAVNRLAPPSKVRILPPPSIETGLTCL